MCNLLIKHADFLEGKREVVKAHNRLITDLDRPKLPNQAMGPLFK